MNTDGRSHNIRLRYKDEFNVIIIGNNLRHNPKSVIKDAGFDPPPPPPPKELPDKWAQLKKKVMLMKQSVVPIQQNQVAKIKRKLISFDVKQHNYREAFRKSKAFFWDCGRPYVIINTVSQH